MARAPACVITDESLQVVASGLNYLDVDMYYYRDRLNINRGFYQGLGSGKD